MASSKVTASSLCAVPDCGKYRQDGIYCRRHGREHGDTRTVRQLDQKRLERRNAAYDAAQVPDRVGCGPWERTVDGLTFTVVWNGTQQ
jgi:hypothetical protein